MEIVAALAGAVAGAVVGSLCAVIWDRIQVPKRLMNALRAELAVNKKLCQRSLETNRKTVATLKLEDRSEANRDETIDDDFKVYVVAPVDIPLETWVSHEFSFFSPELPIQRFLEYKGILGRLKYLVARHQAFRFRPNFVRALIDVEDELVRAIESIEIGLGKKK